MEFDEEGVRVMSCRNTQGRINLMQNKKFDTRGKYKTMKLKLLLTAILALGFAGTAQATSVSEDQGEANTLVTAAATPAASSATASIIASGVASAISPGGGFPPPAINVSTFLDTRSQSGVAAGGSQKKAGAWVQGGYTTIESTDLGGEFEGDVYNLVAGLDYKVNKNAVVGLSLAYEDVDVDTTFNSGTFKGDGFTIAPYAGIGFTNCLQLLTVCSATQCLTTMLRVPIPVPLMPRVIWDP